METQSYNLNLALTLAFPHSTGAAGWGQLGWGGKVGWMMSAFKKGRRVRVGVVVTSILFHLSPIQSQT